MGLSVPSRSQKTPRRGVNNAVTLSRWSSSGSETTWLLIAWIVAQADSVSLCDDYHYWRPLPDGVGLLPLFEAWRAKASPIRWGPSPGRRRQDSETGRLRGAWSYRVRDMDWARPVISPSVVLRSPSSYLRLLAASCARRNPLPGRHWPSAGKRWPRSAGPLHRVSVLPCRDHCHH